MTETVQTTAPAAVEAAPVESAPEVVVYPAPTEGQTKRAYLVSLGLAVAVDKNGVAPRGRFSTEGARALAVAEAAGFVFADTKPARKPRVAKTVAPEAESVEAAAVTPATVTIAPLPQAPEPVRVENRAGGFFGRMKGRR